MRHVDVISGGVAHGKVHRIESQHYGPEDVDSETTVVDSVGQRLTLKIENARGGGGQRRISLFCPFWIVNTTEHALRYKQEKNTSFVSGTVVSAKQDGSKPVDGSDRDDVVIREKKLQTSPKIVQRRLERERKQTNQETVFAGMPGALATSPGQCNLNPSELVKLIAKDMPLHQLTRMAFMFNFNEDVLLLGHQKLCVQLGDALSEYASDWSSGFSLDSVGVTQIVG